MRMGKMTHIVNQLPSIDYTGIMSILKVCGEGLVYLALDPSLGDLPDKLFDLVPNLINFEAINTIYSSSILCEDKYNKKLDFKTFIKTLSNDSGIPLSETLMTMLNTDQPMYIINKKGLFVIGNPAWENVTGYISSECYLKNYRFCISGLTDRSTRSLLRKTIMWDNQVSQELNVIFSCCDKLKVFSTQMLIYSNFVVNEGDEIPRNCLNLKFIAEMANEKTKKKQYLIENKLDFNEYHFIRLSLISSPSKLTSDFIGCNILNENDCDSDGNEDDDKI
jgi:hypothetical protein